MWMECILFEAHILLLSQGTLGAITVAHALHWKRP